MEVGHQTKPQNMESLKFGILTVSDTCYKKEKVDSAGPKLEQEITKAFPGCTFLRKIVPDDVIQIRETLELWTKYGCNVIITVGGTGFSSRDVTPEATRAFIQREAPNIAQALSSRSLAVTELAMLSRAVCGIHSKTLIVNFPGSAKAAVECFGFIKGALLHAIALLTDNKDLVASAHQALQAVLTPSKVNLDNAADRNRKSPYPMLEVNDAFRIIMQECTPTVEKEVVSFDKAIDRVLAEDVYAEDPVPPFRASIKDGYAVRVSDGIGERVVREVTAAGDQPSEEELKAGEVIRISTGAPVPLGADAVVQVEDTTLIKKSADGTQEEVIRINIAPTEGQDIRQVGSDIPGGAIVLNTYDRISAAHVGVLATLGKTEVKVFKRKSIGILSTGNEIKHPSEPLKRGQIRDSNKFTLLNLLKKYSYECNDCGTAEDKPDFVKNALEKAFAGNDIVVSTGGVSMGEYDILKQVLVQDFEAIIHFARMNMKPGKPTTFATLKYKGEIKLFFGLPGNPVSCCVTSLLLVIPALRYLERSRVYQFPSVLVYVSEPLINNDQRPEYHRVRITPDQNGRLMATSTGNQISSRLNSVVGANGLLIVDYSKVHEAGDSATERSIDNPFGVKLNKRNQSAGTSTAMTAIIFDNIV